MVSVIIPVYNAEKTLGRAIKSVLNQAFVSQLIIVNDASTDHSLSIIAFFRTTYFFPNGNIKLDLRSLDDNKGVSAARNLGLEWVTSPLVSFLDADDEYLPGRFYENVLQLIENKEIEGIYSPVQVKYEGISAKENHQKMSNEKEIIGDIGELNDRLFSNFLGCSGKYFLLSGLLIRRKSILNIGFFDPDYAYCQDTDWLLRITSTLALLPSKSKDPLVIIWRHAENRILDGSAASVFRYALLKKWLPYVLTRKDFAFKQKLFFINSLLVNPIKSGRHKIFKILTAFEMCIRNPRILSWLIKQ